MEGCALETWGGRVGGGIPHPLDAPFPPEMGSGSSPSTQTVSTSPLGEARSRPRKQTKPWLSPEENLAPCGREARTGVLGSWVALGKGTDPLGLTQLPQKTDW